MTTKEQQHRNILITTLVLVLVVVAVAVIGFFVLGKQPEVVQGQVEVSEYRVSCKLPGRVVELRAKEGDYVHVGDTLAIIEVPEVDAQKKAAEATEGAADAMSRMAQKGARQEQIQAAYQLLQQAKAALDVTQKSYQRVERLFNEGVMTAQKRDEALAAYKASEAQVKAAESQYEMAKKGAREEEKQAAQQQAKAAKSAVEIVSSLLRETVQIAQCEGEVSDVYPKVGELLGIGSPIMSIAMMDDIWGTFNVREDQLKGLAVGETFKAYVPAFDKDVEMKVFHMKDQGTYAAWRATKASGGYDMKTFEVKARPTSKVDGLRPGMTLVIK